MNKVRQSQRLRALLRDKPEKKKTGRLKPILSEGLKARNLIEKTEKKTKLGNEFK
jgi:hypothetical protein